MQCSVGPVGHEGHTGYARSCRPGVPGQGVGGGGPELEALEFWVWLEVSAEGSQEES